MAGITYTIGANGKPMIAEMDRVQVAAERFKKNVAAKTSGGLQFENDNKAERNLIGIVAGLGNAQNSTQMLSLGLNNLGDVFQNSLATGVVVALGAQLLTMADQADSAFKNMIAGADATVNSISKLSVMAGSNSELGAGFKAASDGLKNLRAEEARQQSVVGSIGTRINSWLGGEGVQEAANRVQKEMSRLAFHHATLEVRSIELSEARVKRSNLIAEGDERSIAALERQLKLDKEIYEIAVSSLGAEARRAAIQAARIESRNEEIKQEKDRQKAVKDAEEKTTDSLTVNRARLDKGDIEAEDIERKIKLTRELQAVTENKNLMPWEQARAINLIMEREEIASKQRLKDIGKQIEEEADADQEKIADRRKKHREDIEKQKIDEAKKADDDMRKLHEKADADIAKSLETLEERRKSKLKPEQRLAEAKAEMENAREIFGKFAPGSLKQKQAGALLAEKTMEFEKLREEKREKDIQRAMGGSIAEGQARKAERAEDRARARAERKVTNREVEAKRAEMERDRKPQKEINAALDAIRAVKKPEVKDAQGDIKKATESSAASLVKILAKLTVA